MLAQHGGAQPRGCRLPGKAFRVTASHTVRGTGIVFHEHMFVTYRSHRTAPDYSVSASRCQDSGSSSSLRVYLVRS